jgi:hypothetical protein
MHQHLSEVGAMGLVLGLVQHQLHRTADTLRIFGDQQSAFARGHVPPHTAPERNGAVTRQWMQEAYGRSTFDAVGQHAARPSI